MQNMQLLHGAWDGMQAAAFCWACHALPPELHKSHAHGKEAGICCRKGQCNAVKSSAALADVVARLGTRAWCFDDASLDYGS